MDRPPDDALWRLEEQFWQGGADFYELALAADALMVLPPPAGVLDRPATIDSIRSAGRWKHVRITGRHQALVDPGVAVLAYSVQADRGEDDTAYAAQCSSTYVRDDDRWRLLLHHQAPLPS